MNILIIAATQLEIKTLLSKLNDDKQLDTKCIKHHIDILITGVGLVFTTYHVSRYLEKKQYDLCINIGIAGSFNKNLSIGEVVNVQQDEFSDIGAERADGFQSIFDLGFAEVNQFPFENGKLINRSFHHKYLESIKNVSAISANTAHGYESSINEVSKKYKADIETMEGAAFFYVCMNEQVDCLQIRSISNYMEANNRHNWNIPLAISNLTNFVFELLCNL